MRAKRLAIIARAQLGGAPVFNSETLRYNVTRSACLTNCNT